MARLESDARAARLWIDQRQSDLISAGQSAGPAAAGAGRPGQALAKNEQEQSAGGRSWPAGTGTVRSPAGVVAAGAGGKSCLARLAAAEAAQQQTAASAAEKSEELQRAAEQLETQNASFSRRRPTSRSSVKRSNGGPITWTNAGPRWNNSAASWRRIHRETLEIRLATEELWVQLSGAAPPAALVRSLGRIRTKLADQYRQAGAELAEQKKELEAIRGQLNTQHEKLVEHKRRLEQWAAGRQEECEKQAARLVAREEQLHREETWLREQSRRWQAERAGFQCELQPLAGKDRSAAARRR